MKTIATLIVLNLLMIQAALGQRRDFIQVGLMPCFIKLSQNEQYDTVRPKLGLLIGYGLRKEFRGKKGIDLVARYSYQSAYRGVYNERYVGPPIYFVYGPDLVLSRRYNIHYLHIRPTLYFQLFKGCRVETGIYYGVLLYENSFNLLSKERIRVVSNKQDLGPLLSLSYKFGSNMVSIGCQISLLPFEGNFNYGKYLNTFPLTYSRYFNSETKK